MSGNDENKVRILEERIADLEKRLEKVEKLLENINKVGRAATRRGPWIFEPSRRDADWVRREDRR